MHVPAAHYASSEQVIVEQYPSSEHSDKLPQTYLEFQRVHGDSQVWVELLHLVFEEHSKRPPVSGEQI